MLAAKPIKFGRFAFFMAIPISAGYIDCEIKSEPFLSFERSTLKSS